MATAKKKPASGGPRQYRVLSFDGGPSTVDYLRQLRVIEHERPGFLDRVDMFAGTSDGAWAALHMATRAPGTLGIDVIDQAIVFNEQIVSSLSLGPLGLLRLATGLTSAIDNGKLLRSLERAYGNGPDGKPITMRDVHRDVCAVTFHLGQQPAKPGARFYHNLARTMKELPDGGSHLPFEDLDTPVAEVALRSGSFPVLMPIRAGFADGGLFANNPSMSALTQAMEFRRLLGFHGIDEVTLLSCGADDAVLGGDWLQRRIRNAKDADWGWGAWLLLPWAPLVLVDAVVTASGRGVSYQCRQLLEDRFLRLGTDMGVTFGQQVLRLIEGRTGKLYREADEHVRRWAEGADGLAFYPSLQHTLRWVDRVWMQD